MKVFLMNTSKATGGGSKSPQCRVCGDESSGFHYGVDSCEGCKGFFRRCITQGMNHKCANEEKCEMTPYTRNSCQYCRLKKCFEVGMSREASRLGRRPKRMKDVSGESSRSHCNLPIAPYPSQEELRQLRMAELQKLLQANGTFKSELMQAFLSAAQHGFREHSKSGGNTSSSANSTSSGSTVANSAFASPSTLSSSMSASVLPADVNLNTTNPSLMSFDPDLLNVDSCSPLQVPSPFADLSTADLSPLPAGLNLNMQMYAPNSQGLTDNMPSPVILSPNDNMDPCSPSEFLTLNSNNSLASPLGSGSSPCNNANINNIMTATTTASTTAASSATNIMSGIENLNANTNNLQQQQQMPPPLAKTSTSSTSSSSSSVVVKQEPSEGTSSIKQEPADNEPSCDSTSVPKSKVKKEGFTMCSLPNTLANVEDVLTEVKMNPNDSRRLLIHQVTDLIVDSHLGTTVNTYANVAQAKIDIGARGTEMPDMSKLSLDPTALWNQFLSSLIPEITKVVRFSKKLPGFWEISNSDQISLIKQGTFEVMVARFCVLVDHEKELMLDPKLTRLSPRHVILSTPMGQFLDEFFWIAKKFNPLHLTDGEIGLFTSIMMMCPDRHGLENRIPVQKIQELFLQALYFLMKHNHPDADQTFKTLIGLIPEFRKVNDDHNRFLNTIKMTMPDEFVNQFPGLHQEVFDSDSSLE